ncbi:hypothetical protein BD289DRAFT_372325 [Coniella lustricola]|uniref:Uncharacterized protein n=1 Tax=Coniella lustricola TaxID=2025994 RepID=A0A2T3A2N9_9PEZI|nr:hypothetical protein BD289DRAFT_372325 [Coniella lustricola]
MAPANNNYSYSKGGNSNSPAGAGQGQNNQGAPAPQTNYRMIKDGWGNRPNFQASYGLGMDPEGIEEGNRILESFREADRQQHNGGNKK